MVDNLIKLFEYDQTDFSTIGLGVISDAATCVVTEVRNGEFLLEMTYPVSGRRFKDLQLSRIIVSKSNPFSKPQAFRIYSLSKPMRGQITVKARHISYDLTGIPVPPISAKGISATIVEIQNGAEKFRQDIPFTLYTDKDPTTNVAEFYTNVPRSYRSLLGGDDPSLLGTFKGEYEFDNFDIWLRAHRGSDNGVTIRYGKNLTELNADSDDENSYTGVYPYWISATEDSSELIELTEKIVTDGRTHAYDKIYIMDLSSDYQEQPTEEVMRSRAQTYLNEHSRSSIKNSIKVSFVQLSKSEEYKDYLVLDSVKLCDTVTVIHENLGINEKLKCTETKYNAITDRYDELILGEAQASLTNTISEQNRAIDNAPSRSVMDSAISRATKLITGGLGGYVVFGNSQQSEYPDEILIMDNPDKSQAVNVWRWNQNGLAFSNTGYGGEYSLAITADGQIVADKITSGQLDASIIKAGSIEISAISESFKSSLDDTYAGKEFTENEIASLKSDISGIQIGYENRTVGGINLIQNSSGLNGLSDWTRARTVKVSSDTDVINKTTAKSAFVVGDETGNPASLYQKINVISGTEYTITIKAKIISHQSSVRASIYLGNDSGTKTILDETSVSNAWKVITGSFTPTMDYVILYAESTNCQLYLADLMLVEGKTKSNWTPAPNEIYTTNVSIDRRGIHITNGESDTQTLIDNTQFAVKSGGDTVLTVNKDLTSLRKTIIEDELTIAKSRFVPVDILEQGEIVDHGIDFIILD